jgi:hypothetical protein
MTNWTRRVAMSLPAPTTPMMFDLPQPLFHCPKGNGIRIGRKLVDDLSITCQTGIGYVAVIADSFFRQLER